MCVCVDGDCECPWLRVEGMHTVRINVVQCVCSVGVCKDVHMGMGMYVSVSLCTGVCGV